MDPFYTFHVDQLWDDREALVNIAKENFHES